MKTNAKGNVAKKAPAFVARAERAFRRVARKLRSENRALGLPAVVWANGKQRPTIAERAARVDRGKVDSILARVPDVAPQAGDER